MTEEIRSIEEIENTIQRKKRKKKTEREERRHDEINEHNVDSYSYCHGGGWAGRPVSCNSGIDTYGSCTGEWISLV